MISRRGFIKSGCAACMLTAAGASLLQSCAAPLPMLKVDNANKQVIKIDPASFVPEKGNMLIVRTKQMEFDILLIKDGDKYRSLYLKCTHESNELVPTATRIHCSAHGSMFDLEGRVLKDPALRPLKTFKTELIDNQILILLS